MYANKKVEAPKLVENEIAAMQEEVMELLERTSELYLKPGTRKEKAAPSTQELKITPTSINSKIINDFSQITRLFESKIASAKLIFRASENSFSIREFHKKCDGISGTLIVAET